jgi:hypothetical protein
MQILNFLDLLSYRLLHHACCTIISALQVAPSYRTLSRRCNYFANQIHASIESVPLDETSRRECTGTPGSNLNRIIIEGNTAAFPTQSLSIRTQHHYHLSKRFQNDELETFCGIVWALFIFSRSWPESSSLRWIPRRSCDSCRSFLDSSSTRT